MVNGNKTRKWEFIVIHIGSESCNFRICVQRMVLFLVKIRNDLFVQNANEIFVGQYEIFALVTCLIGV